MAYSPGQPWDSTLSYTYGQTCTFNGIYYRYWHEIIPSTVGKNPTEDMKLFTASNGFESASRLERAWVMESYDIKKLQTTIRGLGAENVMYSARYDTQPTISFTTPDLANKRQHSWPFYGSGLGKSTDFGLENPDPTPPIPATDGNPNVTGQNYIDQGVPFSAPEPVTQAFYVTPEHPVADHQYMVVRCWPDPITSIDTSAAVDLGIINSFDRTVNFRFKVVRTNYLTTPPTVTTTYESPGSVSSGPYRDNWRNTPVESPVFDIPGSYPSAVIGDIQLHVTSVTPRYDS